MADVPIPSLVYAVNESGERLIRDPECFDGPPLWRVFSVTASKFSGKVWLTAVGPMLKKDGTQGRHHRYFPLEALTQDQPSWVDAIQDDAEMRLS